MPDPSSKAVTRSHSTARRVLSATKVCLDPLWRVRKTAFGGQVFFSYAPPPTTLSWAATPNDLR
eukprot:5881291-Pleurochrysis_carterae.AAC.1